MKKTTVFIVSAYLNTDQDSLVVVGVYPNLYKAASKANKYAFGKKSNKNLQWRECTWDDNAILSNTLSNETIYISQKKVKL